MRKRQFARLAAVAAGATLAWGSAAPAYASGPSLEPEHANRTAASFADQDCQDPQFEGRRPDQDGWRFFLPEGGAQFVSITLEFQTPTGTETLTIPADHGLIVPDQPKQAYLFTPAGWVLLAGSAQVSTAVGPVDQVFRVGHTCAGEPTSGGPAPSAPPATAGPETPATASPDQQALPGESDRRLPMTGVQVGAMVLLGSGLLAGGIAMLTVRRRQSVAHLFDEG